MSINSARGGWGIAPWGRADWGNAKSSYAAGYEVSTPENHALYVPLTQVIRCTTYAATSWIDLENYTVEISEDDGVTYSPALASDGIFVYPYNGLRSKIYRKDSHRLVVVFHKRSQWTANTRVVVRVAGVDEFGVDVVQTPTLFWDELV